MTGTGTQSDPYIISDFDEFRTKANSGTATSNHIYITIPSGTVWDLDKYTQPKYQGFRIIGEGVTINGNGVRIKNFKFDASNTSSPYCAIYMKDTIISDVNFENVQLLKNNACFVYTVGDESSNIAQFTWCTITGTTVTNSVFFNGSSNSYLKFEQCVTRLKLNNGGIFANTLINTITNISILDIDTENGYGYYIKLTKFSDSKLQGSLNDTDIEVYCYNQWQSAFNVYLNASGSLTIRHNTTGSFVNVINADRIEGTITRTGKDIEVTDTQMKNRSYLQSVGFHFGDFWQPDDYGYPTPPQAPLRNYKPLGAFANNSNLTKVQIPKSVKFIGRETFANTGLTEVTIASDGVYFNDSFPQGCNIKFYED